MALLAESGMMLIGAEPQPPAGGHSGDGGEFAGALSLCTACVPDGIENSQGLREVDSSSASAPAFPAFPLTSGADAGWQSAQSSNELPELRATEAERADAPLPLSAAEAAPACMQSRGECQSTAPREGMVSRPATAAAMERVRPSSALRYELAGVVMPEFEIGPEGQANDGDDGRPHPSGPLPEPRQPLRFGRADETALPRPATEASGGTGAPSGGEPATAIAHAQGAQLMAEPEQTSAADAQARALVQAARVSRAESSRAPIAFAVRLRDEQTESPGEREAQGKRTARAAAGLLSQAERYAAPCMEADELRLRQPYEFADPDPVPPLGRTGPADITQAGNAGACRQQTAPKAREEARQSTDSCPARGQAAEPVQPRASSPVETLLVTALETRPDTIRTQAIPAAPKSWEGVRVQIPPAQPDELLEARGAVRTLRLSVEAAPGRPVSLLFTAEPGAVKVLARSADPVMSEALRTNIEALREAGFEAVRSEEAAGNGLDRAVRPDAGSNESGHSEDGRRHPAEQGDTGGERTNKNLERWFEALDRQTQALAGPQEGEDQA